MKTIFLAFFFVLALLPVAGAEALYPKPEGYVLDRADFLNEEEEARLEESLSALEEVYTAEYAIAILPSLEGADLESFANGLFRDWGLGQKELNNGLLLLVDAENRGLRFEVGYGLEGVIPDALAFQMIEETLKPGFRQEAYAEALTQSVTQVELLLQGEPLPELSFWDQFGDTLPVFFFIGLFFLQGFLMLLWALVRKLSESRHWWPGALIGGVFAGGFFFLLPWGFAWDFFAWTLCAGLLFGGLVDFILSTLLQPTIKKHGPSLDSFLARWFGDSGGGGGFGGGDFGGGFGGGSSGGGGASGSW